MTTKKPAITQTESEVNKTNQRYRAGRVKVNPKLKENNGKIESAFALLITYFAFIEFFK